MNNFVAFNQVYARYFGESAPARSCVEVARLPKDVCWSKSKPSPTSEPVSLEKPLPGGAFASVGRMDAPLCRSAIMGLNFALLVTGPPMAQRPPRPIVLP